MRQKKYAYLLFNNCTILNTIPYTTSIKGRQQPPPLSPQKNIYVIFACYIQRGISATGVVAASGPHINSLKFTCNGIGYKLASLILGDIQHKKCPKEFIKKSACG